MVADGFYTNAFLKTEEQILKHKVLQPHCNILDKIPINGLEKIIKKSENQIILIENADCNLIYNKTIMEIFIENNWNTSNIRFVDAYSYKHIYKTSYMKDKNTRKAEAYINLVNANNA